MWVELDRGDVVTMSCKRKLLRKAREAVAILLLVLTVLHLAHLALQFGYLAALDHTQPASGYLLLEADYRRPFLLEETVQARIWLNCCLLLKNCGGLLEATLLQVAENCLVTASRISGGQREE